MRTCCEPWTLAGRRSFAANISIGWAGQLHCAGRELACIHEPNSC